MATSTSLPAAPGQQRAIADGKEAKAKIGEPPVPDDRLRRQADDRVVAMPTGELMKEMRRTSWTHRQLDGDQQFLRRKRCFVDPGEELARRNPPLAARPASNDGSAKREHAGRQFGGWVGMRKAAPDGAAVADRRMRDMGDRIRQQRSMGCYFRRFQEIDVARQRTDGEDAFLHRNPAQLGQLADIDNEFGRDQAQIHRRQQALAARQHLGPVAMRGQQFQRVCDAGCAGVSESRGFHFWRDLPGQVSAFSLD